MLAPPARWAFLQQLVLPSLESGFVLQVIAEEELLAAAVEDIALLHSKFAQSVSHHSHH